MLTYLAGLCSSTLSVIFIIFIIGALGFMLGGINVKGISLGTAGVLIVALAYGILIHYFPEFSIEEKKITLWSNSIKSSFGLVSNIGTALFVTAVGLIEHLMQDGGWDQHHIAGKQMVDAVTDETSTLSRKDIVDFVIRMIVRFSHIK